METLQKAWEKCTTNSAGLLQVIGVELLVALGTETILSLGDELFSGVLGGIWSLLAMLANIVVFYMSVLSGLHLLELEVVEGKKMSFLDSLKEYFTWFKANWKLGWQPWLLWQVVIPAGALLLTGIAAGLLFGLLSGLWSTEMHHLLRLFEHDLNLFELIGNFAGDFKGTTILLLIFVFLILLSIELIRSALNYRGYYGVASKVCDDAPLETAVYKECLWMALLKTIVLLGVFLLTILLLIMVLHMHKIAGFLGLLISIIWAVTGLAMFVYEFVVEVKVLLDVQKMPKPVFASTQATAAAQKPVAEKPVIEPASKAAEKEAEKPMEKPVIETAAESLETAAQKPADTTEKTGMEKPVKEERPEEKATENEKVETENKQIDTKENKAEEKKD